MNADADISPTLRHEITVRRLRELLAELHDDDVLVPNQVENLAILRDRQQVGYIDLLVNQQSVEIYEP